MQRCQAESYCKLFNEQRTNCHEHCIGYIQMQNIYNLSSMPKRYQYENPLVPEEADRDAFLYLRDWQNSVQDHVEKGDGLFLLSEKRGTGKTSWACKIMNEYFRKVALGNNLTCRGLFVNVPEFFRQLKNSFDNPNDEFAEMLQNIKTADLVIWDDIGTESPSNFVRETLYTFINHRESNMLSQIFTSNIPLETMRKQDYLGETIVSRIIGSSKLVEFQSDVDRRIDSL